MSLKKLLGKLTQSNKEIPADIRLLTMVTSIRWFGWGFAETLIPVLLFSFGNNFAEAGILKAAVDITFILALPVVGMLADKVRSTTLILIGLFLYLFVGLGYFLAGITGMLIFVILARLINGVSWGLDVVGRETYFRRHVSKDKIATTFGYFDTMTRFWWIVSAVLGIYLVKYFTIANLLFLITPFSLVSLLVVINFRKKKEHVHIVETQKSSINFLREIKGWNLLLKSVVGFNTVIAFSGAVVLFFLPIEIYRESGNLTMVILMGIAYALPTLMGWSLGKFFDKRGYKTLGTSLIVFALLLMSLSFLTGFFWRLAIVLVISMVLELISVGSNELVTVAAKPEHFGRVDGIMKSVMAIGGMMGPIMVGAIIDLTSVGSAYISLSMVIFAVAIIFKVLDKKGFIEKYTPVE